MKFVGDQNEFLVGLSSRLKKSLQRLDYNQNEIADILGITQPALSKIINGRGGISMSVLYSIAKNFDINWNWVITGEGEKTYTDTGDNVEVIGRLDDVRSYKREIEHLQEQIKMKDKIIQLLEDRHK